MIRGKKGDLPITLLVIGVIAICGLALITFVISDLKVSNSFVGVDLMHELNAQVDLYDFYKNNGILDKDLLSEFDIKEIDGELYFYLEKTRSRFSFSKLGTEEVVLFSVRHPVPLS